MRIERVEKIHGVSRFVEYINCEVVHVLKIGLEERGKARNYLLHTC